ncbi:AGE family epimerase/isomerase [Colwelliaceae bacterium 6441]
MSQQDHFKSVSFLRSHIQETMSFYHPNCIDPTGGFYHYFNDEGAIYDRNNKHLVSSCRFVFNYAMAAIEFKQPEYLIQVRQGLDFIETKHKNPQTGGYFWEINGEKIVDATHHCYGLAFVLLANAVAVKAGVTQANATIDYVWDFLEAHFWDTNYGCYIDEYNEHMDVASDYRGQNANMHMCEALLMTFEATENHRYLERAYQLAKTFCIGLAEQTNGLIWEHYNSQWQVDWAYNLDNPKHLFRPWGFQPGHQTEWAKLLIILNRHQPETWMLEKAQFLFNKTMELAWDNNHGGLVYGFSPQYAICDGDKYFWVQAESLATAALLAIETGDDSFWLWYEKIWQYCWSHMIDHDFGAWYRILNRENEKYSNEKSPAGKTDYHTMGACYEVMRALRLSEDNS